MGTLFGAFLLTDPLLKEASPGKTAEKTKDIKQKNPIKPDSSPCENGPQWHIMSASTAQGWAVISYAISEEKFQFCFVWFFFLKCDVMSAFHKPCS